MIEEFDEYTHNFDMNNIKIKRKYDHSYRVMELSKKYATLLGFDKHDIELATIIGLLHDIGRFEQLKQYDTFDDSISFDHATYGCKLLFDNNMIEKFYSNKEDYEIIRFAIENHNKLKIEETNNEKALMHAKLIRDTDKLDILYLIGYLKEYDIQASDEEITKEVLEQFYNHQSILKNSRKNVNDKIVFTFSYAFDINYDICLEEFKNNFKYFYDKVEINNKFKDIYNEIIKYIDERMNNYVRN